MKPSEYFIKTRINNQRWCDSDEANESTITELDKRFIDREELKDKINKLKKEVKYHKGDDITDMILELIK